MPDEPTQEELLIYIDGKAPVKTYDYRSETDEDDWYSAELYRLEDGRYLRFLPLTGMNSPWAGSSEVFDWIDPGALDKWYKP